MEVVGEVLRDDQDQAMYRYVQRYRASFFLALHRVHRTACVRQAASPWALKDQLRHQLAARERADPVCLVDRLPIPVCVFARAHWRRCFGDTATCGRDRYDPIGTIAADMQAKAGAGLADRSDRAGRSGLLRPGGRAGDRAARRLHPAGGSDLLVAREE